MGLKDKTGCSRPFNGAEGESHSGRPPPFLMGRAGRSGPSKQFIFPILLFPLIFIRAP